jgi:DNA-binding NtrC family response regulator
MSHTPTRGRLLILDKDALARWSLTQYLERWFSVTATDSLDEARRLIARGDVSALVVSDDLPGHQIDAVEDEARRLNPQVTTVRTVTGVLGTKRPTTNSLRLEKPFQLGDLARLLGVSEAELPRVEA